MSKKNDPIAPRSSQYDKGRKGLGGNVSFEAYFLRDLYQRGKIDDALVKDLVAQNQLSVDADELIDALKDSSGESIPRGLAAHIADLAAIVSDQN